MQDRTAEPSLRQVARTGAVHATLLIAGGVVVGGIGGFWALSKDGTDAVAEVAARPFIALVVVLPLLLLLLNFSPANLGMYATPARGLLIGLIGGLGGGLIGALAYIVPATNIPVILGGEDAPDLSTAIREEFGLTRFLVVVGVTAAVGLLAGFATHYRIKAYHRKTRRTED